MKDTRQYYFYSTRDPLLEKDQKLLAKRAQGGDKASEDLLVKSNLRLVVKIAKRVSKGVVSNTFDLDDLISEGSIGLIKAVRSFDPSRGVKFSTFAGRIIQNEMINALRGVASPIRTPQTKAGREIKKSLKVFSLDDPISSDDESCKTLLDTIKSLDPATDDLIVTQDVKARIAKALKTLHPRAQRVLMTHFGIGCKAQSLSVIGGVLNLSKERVHQIECRSLLELSKNNSLLALQAQ